MIRINTAYPTIQGEGCMTGTPMILLRLQGCSVGCPFCDTKETWDHGGGDTWGETRLADMLGKLARLEWVLVTGGEPAEQDLSRLVDVLRGRGHKLALETSGTAAGHLGRRWDWVCVSPKLDMPGGRPIIPDAVRPADEIKFVVGKRPDIDVAAEFLKSVGPLKSDVQICLQPMSLSPVATRICIETAKSRGWRLSLQTHQLIGLP